MLRDRFLQSTFTLLLLSASGCQSARVATPDSTDQRIIALLGATVLDGTDAPPLRDGVIVVEGARIRAVGPRSAVAVPPGARAVDVTGLTVLPGLIDSHVHLALALSTGAGEAGLDSVLAGLLDHGVTSVRDLGGPHPWLVELARAVEAGVRSGPRIFAAGPTLTAPGGHPAGTLLRGNSEAIELGTRQLRDADDARGVARGLGRGGLCGINASVDGGSTRSPYGILPRLATAVLRAVVSEARAVGLPVTVHWSNVGELRYVIAVRPNQIEHPGVTPIPDSLIAQIRAAGIAVDPTLVAYSSFLPANLLASGPFANVRRLAGAGVTITAGTDAPLVGRLGDALHRELELLVQAGLTPIQAIHAATGSAGQQLGASSDVGIIAPGKRADLLVVAGDPLVTISDTRQIRMVLRAGRIVRQ